jgi:hypothetical protein
MDSLVGELNMKLGDRPFYTLRQLISIGFFGSMSAAKTALLGGQLSYVKISPRRIVVPRLALLAFLRNNISEYEDRDD